MIKIPLTQERLKELVIYDQWTGKFYSLVDRKRVKLGDEVGFDLNGYIGFKIDYKMHYAHRLAFLYMTGELPPEDVDHINMDRKDNRWSNLRLATRAQNMANRRNWRGRHLKGASPTNGKKKNRWMAKCKNKHLGTFDTEQQAHEAYLHEAQKEFGEFVRAS